MPVAVTLKLAVAGAVTVRSTGWTVMTGAAFTVKVAALLVALPAALLTVTVYWAPLFPKPVAGVV